MKHEEYKCPKCESENCIGRDTEIKIQISCKTAGFEWTCSKCGLKGQAKYKIEFERHFAIYEKDDDIFELNRI